MEDGDDGHRSIIYLYPYYYYPHWVRNTLQMHTLTRTQRTRYGGAIERKANAQAKVNKGSICGFGGFGNIFACLILLTRRQNTTMLKDEAVLSFHLYFLQSAPIINKDINKLRLELVRRFDSLFLSGIVELILIQQFNSVWIRVGN